MRRHLSAGALGRGILGATALAAAAVAAVGACVGSDPVDAVVAANDGGTSAPGEGPSAADGGTAPVYGAFLTSEVFATSFAADAGEAGAQPVADGICTRLATGAGLAHADRYQAVMIADRGPNAALALLTAVDTLDAGSGSWCSIGLGAKQPSCEGTGVVFASAAALSNGPASPLITDENGAYLPAWSDGKRSHFFSGIYFGASDDFKSAPPRDCNGWSIRDDAGTYVDAGGLPNITSSFGIGNAVAADGDFKWFGEGYEPCETPYTLPLLCLERP